MKTWAYQLSDSKPLTDGEKKVYDALMKWDEIQEDAWSDVATAVRELVHNTDYHYEPYQLPNALWHLINVPAGMTGWIWEMLESTYKGRKNKWNNKHRKIRKALGYNYP